MSNCRNMLVLFSVTLTLTLAGCGKSTQKTLGHMANAERHNVLAIRSGTTPPQVMITGVMIEKCPVAGCWFRLRDSTGTIKVNTQSAGFVVVNVPLQTTMTVAGKVSGEGQGGETEIEATGLRY